MVNGTNGDTQVSHTSLTGHTGSPSSNVTTSVNGNSTSLEESTNATSTNSNMTNNEMETRENNATASSEMAKKTEEANVIAGANLSLTDFIGKDKVPFHFARLTHYVITLHLSTGKYFSS